MFPLLRGTIRYQKGPPGTPLIGLTIRWSPDGVLPATARRGESAGHTGALIHKATAPRPTAGSKVGGNYARERESLRNAATLREPKSLFAQGDFRKGPAAPRARSSLTRKRSQVQILWRLPRKPSADKPVSLLGALGDEQTRRQVLEAFDEAVWGRKVNHLRRGPLARGSMVAFDPVPESDSKFINQIVGLPGEIIEIRHSRVLIDGRPLAQPYLRSGTSM